MTDSQVVGISVVDVYTSAYNQGREHEREISALLLTMAFDHVRISSSFRDLIEEYMRDTRERLSIGRI